MGRASRDGVVSISIDYKKELNQMIQDFESTMTEASSNGNLSKGMKKQFDDAIAELKEFKANMEKSFAELNLKGIVDKDTFKSYKDRVKQNFDSVRETIDGLNLTIGNLNSKVEILGGGLDISKISNQFKNFQDYVQNTHNAIDAMIKELGGQGVSLMSFDQASINSAIDGVKKLENAIKTIDSNSHDEYDLKILDLNEEELQKEVNSISATIEHLKGSMDSLKKDMANPNVGGIQLTKMKAEYEALSLEMKNAYDKMETILNSENLKFPVPDFSATAVGLEEVAEYEDDIEKFVERAKLAKKELQSIIDSTKRPSAKVSDKLDPNSAQVVAGVTIETTSSELWKILSPILDNLQDDLNSNPVVAPVKLVVAPTAVSSEKTGEVGGVTKNYSKKYQKVLAETGEDAIIDLEGVYKKTFTSIMDEAVSYAKETIEKIQNVFESTPIDVKFNMSQEELDKIQNFVLSNKDGKAIDISGQVTKTKTEVKELAEGLEKVKEVLSSTDGKKVSFEGFDKFQEDISSSLAQLVEFKDMLRTLQSMESILSKATGISGTTELTTQWELVSKLITNAIKLDGTFRKNANIGKVAYEYNKYLNMGGTNEISSIDKVAKLEDSANIINTILAKVKELNSQKVDTGSVDKADDELKSVSSTLDDVISRLDHLVNLTRDIGNTFYKMFKEASISDVDKQWSAIESKFKSIAGESGKINLSKQKKDVQELIEMYQKYSNAGGMKTPFDLTDNAETIKKLNKVYEQINSGSGDTSVSKESKGFETVKKSVDDLTTSINTKTDAIKTEANTMELAARAEVKSIQKIIDALTPLIEKIKSIPELKIPKAENVESIGSLDSGNSIKPNPVGTSPTVDNKTNISSGSSPATEQQNKLQEELRETEVQAGQTAQAVREVTSQDQMKDAFQGETGSGNVTEIREDLQEVIPVENQVAENFQEIRQETDKAVESAKKYGNILSQIGLVGAQYNDKGEQIPSRYSYVQQTGEKQVQTVTVKYEKDNETGEIIKSKPIFGDYITGFQALEKEIDKADKKVVDLKKNLELNKLKLGDNYDSSSQEQLIDEAEKYANLLYGALEAYDRQSDYEYSIAQYAEERAKKQANYNTQLQNALKIEQARTKNASDKKDVADEQKRQKNIEQTNRLLNRQQITINGIAKSYNKMANPDLDKAVENPDDLKQLAKKKQEIQGLINKLSGQERNSSNEKEFLQIEKLIAEYKQLAKDKLKANNPSKQQLGGENLKSLLENQVSQYNKLIAQSEKYGSVTEEITTELKKQRDLIAEQDKNGVYRARFTKADGSKLTADDYYEARDSYKINKSVLESYKTDSPELKKQIATYNELITTIEKYKSSATLIAKGNGTDELDAEVATLQVRIEELQNSPILSKEQLQSARDMLEKIEDKLIEIQGTTAVTATKKAEDALPSYSNTLQSYEKSIKKLQDGGWASPTFVSNVNAIKTALDNYKNAIVEVKQKTADGIATQEDVDKLNRYKLALEDAINTTKGMSSSEKGYTFLAGQKELDKINKILKENSAMSKEAKKQIRAYYDQIKYGDPSASLETIHGEIMEIVNAEVEAGRGGKSLLGVIKDKAWYGLASQIGMYFGLNDFIRYIREGIDVVTELDTALTEMRKVSDETVTSLKAYQETTFDVADAVGTTAVQIQNSTADFMRLGESMDEAAESAKTANILMNVSEFESIDDATSALTSMAQAYQDLDKMTIVDKLNEVGKIIAQTYSNVWCYKNIAW